MNNFSNSIGGRQYFLFYIMVFLPYTNFLPIRQEIFIAIFCLTFFYFIIRSERFSSNFWLTLSITLFIFFVQTITFYKYYGPPFYGVVMSISLSYFVVRIFKINYLKLFVNIVTGITSISFLFYFPSLVSTRFYDFVSRIAPSLGTDVLLYNQNFLIFTFEGYGDSGIMRNSGNFTEPGYFACYLVAALALNFLYFKETLTFKNLILTVGIITTFSTAGYLSLFFLLLFYILFNVKKMVFKFFLALLIVFAGYYSYKKLSFLQAKITTQFETQVNGETTSGRFGAMIADIHDMEEYPIFGRGLIKNTRFDGVEYWTGDNAPRETLNSITNTLVRYGIPFGLLMFVLLFRSVRILFLRNGLRIKDVFIFLVAIAIVISSQDILSTTFFWSIFYFSELLPLRSNVGLMS